MDLTLSTPQHVFLRQLPTKFRAYVGGYGSGKTFIGCLDLLLFALEHKHVTQGYFGPSYPSIRDIFYPTIEEAAALVGMNVKIRRGDKEVDLYRGGWQVGQIICRSMDKPESIVGFKIARALVDEIDILPKDKASRAWNKIIARLRLVIDGVINGIGVTCSPEGFLFVYSKFKKDPTPSYSMVQASTYENSEHLPDDYIEVLLETYSEQLVSAYVDGNFVNLTSGSVYPLFDRQLNNTNVEHAHGEMLHVGMDFNVYKMYAGINVIRNNKGYAVDELVNVKDTPTMCFKLKNRFPNNPIVIYPDASGKHKSTSGASRSDLNILKAEGFQVSAPQKNPFVKDRVNSVNARICDGTGSRHYFVNVRKCPVLTDCLEQQAYDDNGEPDKSNDLDHPTDAVGYFIHRRWPADKVRIKQRQSHWK